jgi:Zn-dependent protease with chaperone function
MNVIYPQAPANLPPDFAKPGKEFRAGVVRVVASLIFFIFVYLIMFAAGSLLAAAFAVAGFYVVTAGINYLTILLAAGLVATGLMIFYFLVKFVFENKKAEKEGYVEVTAAEQPELFEFILQVSREVGTDFPKHIYLAPDVNAAVFYDSNILSLFFPVKKNLVIGLGVVNVLNLSEFKAVLAHEFGHFSQKSTRAGSYVYVANRIIYNMLFENQKYGSVLDDIARLHSVIALFIRLTVKIVQGMQWVQRQAYTIVNLQFNYLARQMEFHADAVAASVADSNNLTHALHLIEVGDTVYDATMSQYSQWAGEGLMAYNLYQDHQTAARYYAIANRLPYANGRPVMKAALHYFTTYRKVNIDNQWASHPTTEQREAALLALNAIGEEVATPAWALFQQQEKLQGEFTKALYAKVKWDKPCTVAGPERFEKEMNDSREKYNMPEFYMGYYTDRLITTFGTDHVNLIANKIQDIKAFFSDNASMGRQRTEMGQDIALLQQIISQPGAVRKFNYDGAIHPAKWADTVKLTVEAAAKKMDEEIEDKDKWVYAYFYNAAEKKGEGQQVEELYHLYFALVAHVKSTHERFVKMLNELAPLYSEDKFTDIYKLSPQEISGSITELKLLYRETTGLFNKINAMYSCTMPDKITEVMDFKLPAMNASACSSQNVNDVYDCGYALFIWQQDMSIVVKRQLLEAQLKYL